MSLKTLAVVLLLTSLSVGASQRERPVRAADLLAGRTWFLQKPSADAATLMTVSAEETPGGTAALHITIARATDPFYPAFLIGHLMGTSKKLWSSMARREAFVKFWKWTLGPGYNPALFGHSIMHDTQ